MRNDANSAKTTQGWSASGFSRGQRRRVMAALRMAHRVLGLKRKDLGVGPFALGGGRVALRVSGIAGAALATAASALWLPAAATFVSLASFSSAALAGTCVQSDAQGTNSAMGTGSSAAVTCGAFSIAIGAGSGGQASNFGVAVGDAAVSTGTNSVAIGRQASATGVNSAAFGQGASVTSLGATAIGSGAKATQSYATAVGRSTTASGAGAVAIGANASGSATAASANAIAHGGQSSVDANSAGAIATGVASKVTYAANAIALGNGAQVNGAAGAANVSDDAIAIGHSATVSAAAARSVVIGVNAAGTAGDSVAVGNLAAASNDQAVAVGKGSKASGQYTVALGGGSTATAQGALAVGSSAQATGNYSISFGWNTKASGQGTVALGNGSQALDTQTVAIGDHATVNAGGLNSAAIGTGATVSANVTNALAIGSYSSAQATGAIAFGRNTSAGSGDSISIGSSTSVDANSSSSIATGRSSVVTYAMNAIAFGTNAQVNGAAGSLSTRSIAIGNSAVVSAGATDAIAQGTDVSAQSAESVAIGKAATAKGGKAVSIGSGNTADGDGAVAIGDPNSATGTGAIALGKDNTANGTGALAIGNTNTATGQGSIALGSASKAEAAGALAFGDTADAKVQNAIALGANAVANNAGDVALGSGSATAGSNPTAGATIAGTFYNFAGTNPASVVSVGAPGSERQITNVAAGQVNASSTDAINGSQLYASNQAIGVVNNHLTTLGNNAAAVLGGNATYDATTGGLTMSNVGGTGQNTVNDAIASVATTANKGWNVTTGNTGTGTVSGTSVANVAPGATQTVTAGNNIAITQNGTDLTIATNPDLVSTSVTTGNSKLDTSGLTITGGPNNTVSLTGSGLDNGGNQVVNVAAGTLSATSTDAVNGSQLNATNTYINTSLGGGADVGTGTAPSYTIGGNTYNNVGDAFTAVNNGTVGVVQRTATTDVATMTAAGGDATNPGNAQKLTNLAAGTIASGSTDAINGSQLFALGSSSATVLGGNATYNTTTGEVTMTNVGGTGQNTVNDAIASVAATAGAGWNLTAAGANGTNVAPGAAVDLKNSDGNIVVSKTTSSNDVNFDLAQDLAVTSVTTGNSKLDTNGLTITGGPNSTVSLTGSGLDNGGNKVVNVAAGTIGSGSTDAINGSQLFALGSSSAAVLGGNATYNTTTGEVTMTNIGGTGQNTVNDAIASVSTTASKGWNVTTSASGTGTASGTTVANVAPGATQTVTAGNNIAITQNGADLTIATNPDLVSTSVTTGNSKLDTNGLTIAGGPNSIVSLTGSGLDNGDNKIVNVAAGTLSATSTDAVNGSQLFATNQAVTNITGGSSGVVQRTAAPDVTTLTAAGGDAANPGNPQKLTNLAAGTAANDAVNYSQLQAAQAAATTHYYSVNDGGTQSGNYTNNGATGVNSLAVGVDASTNASSGIAIGDGSQVTESTANASQSSIAIGKSNLISDSANTAALGNGNTVTDSSVIGILGGSNVVAQTTESSIIGVRNTLSNNVSGTGVIGKDNLLSNVGGSSVIGSDNKLTDVSAVALIGGSNEAKGGSTASTAIGIGNTLDGANASSITGIGNTVRDSSEVGVIGVANTVSGGTQNAIIGSNNTLDTATKTFVAGFGNTLGANLDTVQVVASGATVASGIARSIVIGSGGTLGGNDAVAIGTGAQALSDEAVAIGRSATATGGKAVSIGSGNTADGDGAVAIGDPNSATGAGAVALGKDNTANGAGAVALGNTNTATGQGAVALGSNSTAQGVGTIALGQSANASAVNGLALGSNSVATNANDVALGSGSVTAAPSTGPLTINGGTVKGTAPTSVVSVGSAGNERQITNVAAGTVSASSTDAINGSQLFAVGTSLNMLGSSSATVLGGNATYDPTTGQMTMTNVGGTGQNTVHDAIASVASTAGKGWDLTAQGANGTNVAPGATVDLKNGDGNIKVAKTAANNDVTFDLADDVTLKGSLSVDDGSGNKSQLTTGGLAVTDAAGNNASYGAAGFSLFGPGSVAGPSITMNSFSAGGLVVQNVAAGAVNATSTDAINGSQLFALGSSAATVLGGNATYDTTTGQVTMSNVGGTGQNNVNDAIASVATTAAAGWNVTTAASGTGTVTGTTVANVAPGATQTVTAGDNIAITQNGTGLTIATNPDLISTSITTGNSKLDTNGLAVDDGTGNKTTVATGGVSVTDGTNTTTVSAGGVSIAGGPSMTVTGIDAGSKTITNVAAGAVNATSTDAVNGSQLYAVQQIAGAGWNLTAQGANSSNVAPNATVDLKNTDGNIVVSKSAASNDVTFNLANDLNVASVTTGNSKLDTNGLTIAGGPSVTVSGIDAGGMKVANVAAGTLSAISTDAVNGSQLYTTNQRVTKVENTAVFYDVDGSGNRKNSITLQGGDANAPVLLSNVATGIADYDAVNVKQLKDTSASTLTQANSYTDNRTAYAISTANAYTDNKAVETLGAANAYTDQKFGQLNSALGDVKKEARQGAAIGLAAASLRYDDRPGKLSTAVGAGVWRGQSAFAMGIGYTTKDQQARFNLSATTSGRQWGVAAGMSFTLN